MCVALFRPDLQARRELSNIVFSKVLTETYLNNTYF